MPRIALAFALVALASCFTGCVTTGSYNAFAKPTVEAIRDPGSPEAIVAVTTASVAFVESRLTLFVLAQRADGHVQLFRGSLQGSDEEMDRPRLEPIAGHAVPETIASVEVTPQRLDAGWDLAVRIPGLAGTSLDLDAEAGHFLLPSPRGATTRTEEHSHPIGTLTFLVLLPVTATMDVAVSTVGIVLGGPILLGVVFGGRGICGC